MVISYKHGEQLPPDKIRHYTSSKLLTTIYYAVFESHMRYGCHIWGQTRNQHISDVVKLQKKEVRIINFVTNTHQQSLYSVNLAYYLLMKLSFSKTVF